MFDSMARVWAELWMLALVHGTLAVGAVTLALRSDTRLDASARHRILLAALCALAVLPIIARPFVQPALTVESSAPVSQETTASLYATSNERPAAPSRVRDELARTSSASGEPDGTSAPAVSSASSASTVASASAPSAAGASSPRSDAPTRATRAKLDGATLRALFAAWLVITIVMFARLTCAAFHIRRLLRTSSPADPELLQQLAAFMDRDRAKLVIRTSAVVRAPVTMGFRRAYIMMPAGMSASLTALELEHVVRHELGHVERRDTHACLLQQLCSALLWLHPAAWMLARRVVAERELACDARVVAAAGDAAAYARSLIRVATISHAAPGLVLASTAVSRSGLAARVEQLMHAPAAPARGIRITTAVGSLLLLSAAFVTPRVAMQAAMHDSTINDRSRDVDSIARRIDAQLETFAQHGFAGVVLVAHNGRVLLHEAYGMADRDARIPMTTGTYFSAAGMTKALTALDAALLENEGRLRIEDPVAKYIDGMPAAKAGVSIHNLLTYTDGIARAGARVSNANRDEFVNAMRATPAAYEAGTASRYTDVGYSLLGVAIENVTNSSYEDFTRERVFTPLGMSASRFEHDPLPVGATRAREYAGPVGAQYPVADREYVWGRRASLGLVTTADDLYRLLQAVERPGALHSNVRARLLTPNTSIDDNSAEGYGWETMKTWYGSRVHRRLAGTPGFEGELIHDLDDGWDAVILVNSAVGWRYAVWSEIALAFRNEPSAPLPRILAQRRYAPYQGGVVTPLPKSATAF